MMLSIPFAYRNSIHAAFIGIGFSCVAMSSLSAGRFDLSGLPEYSPTQTVSGVIRNYGNGYAGLLKKWEDGFREIHREISFRDTLPTSDAAFAALITGITDLAPDGSEPAITETLGFYETYGYHATAIAVGSGTYEVEGRSPGIVIFANKDNPLKQLTLAQLDGIFGSERTGALRGFKWTLEDERDSRQNIRTWGQLGLTGEWADKPIHTFGHAPSGTSRFFELMVLKNSDKWNPNFREYVETGSKMISDTDKSEQHGGVKYMLKQELANDRYGLAWSIMPQAKGISGIKTIALAAEEGGPYIEPSEKSFQSRKYPLVRTIYIYLNRRPGTPVDAKSKEFLLFILSRQGQEIVAKDGGFLPLPAEVIRAERAKLD